MARLDNYETRPSGMDKYLSVYGWHLSKAMAKFALLHLCPESELMDVSTFETLSAKYPKIRAAKGYDAYYLFCKFKIIMPQLSLHQIAPFVETYLSKTYDTAVLTHFYSDCIANEIPIIWEDLL